MSKLLGVFDLFDDLDKISIQDILGLLRTKVDIHNLENYLGNRILFPQTVATSKLEMEIDFAILTLSLKKHPEKVFKQAINQIYIPHLLIPRYPPLPKLVAVFIDSLNLEGVTQIWVQEKNSAELVGSVIPNKLLSQISKKDIENLMIKDQLKKLTLNQLNLIPIQDKQIKIKFSGGHEFDCFGGNLGVLCDLRVKEDAV